MEITEWHKDRLMADIHNLEDTINAYFHEDSELKHAFGLIYRLASTVETEEIDSL